MDDVSIEGEKKEYWLIIQLADVCLAGEKI